MREYRGRGKRLRSNTGSEKEPKGEESTGRSYCNRRRETTNTRRQGEKKKGGEEGRKEAKRNGVNKRSQGKTSERKGRSQMV